MQPVNLILNRPNSLVFVKETHLVGLGRFNEQIRLLQIIYCVLCKDSFFMDYVKLQIAVFVQN